MRIAATNKRLEEILHARVERAVEISVALVVEARELLVIVFRFSELRPFPGVTRRPPPFPSPFSVCTMGWKSSRRSWREWMSKVILISVSAAALLSGCTSLSSGGASAELEALFAEEWTARLEASPLFATRVGDHRANDKLPAVGEKKVRPSLCHRALTCRRASA